VARRISANYHDYFQNSSCEHCHDAWAKPIEYTPPVVLYPGNERVTVTAGAGSRDLLGDGRGATSFIEYGTSELASWRERGDHPSTPYGSPA
jgi:hypothetical protein